MNREPNLDHDDSPAGRPPIGAIGLLVALMLILPAVLFSSFSPDEPLKEGVTVFADERPRAAFLDPDRYRAAGFEERCAVETGTRLTIVQGPAQRPDGLLLARIEGDGPAQPPFCPPQAAVLLHPHQVRQKEGFWQAVTRVLGSVLPR